MPRCCSNCCAAAGARRARVDLGALADVGGDLDVGATAVDLQSHREGVAQIALGGVDVGGRRERKVAQLR